MFWGVLQSRVANSANVNQTSTMACKREKMYCKYDKNASVWCGFAWEVCTSALHMWKTTLGCPCANVKQTFANEALPANVKTTCS